MKKRIALLIALLMLLAALAGCSPAAVETTQSAATPTAIATEAPSASVTAEPEEASTVIFTDSVGREVEVPKNITKIAISGPMAQIVVFALAPDKLVGIADEWDATAEQFLATEYYNLPILGQLYGGKGELNLETLLSSGAEVVIDVGEPKETIVEDIDGLQEQTGIPFVHITATTSTMGDAYRKLGELLNMPDEASELANFCDEVYSRTLEISNSVEKVNLLYCLGDTGQNVLAKTSYHAEVIDMLSNNVALMEDPSSKGSGNEVDMEQILLWNPDVILFAPDSIYGTVAEDKAWQKVSAISSGKYYEVPSAPYNWMGFPPSVQRCLGMMWMSNLLYPEAAQYDLNEEVAKFYKLFYHCDITQEQYDALVANSIGKLEE